MILQAQDTILDTSKILKPNQALAIDETNSIRYVLEIRKDGKIIKKNLDKKTKSILEKQIKEMYANPATITSKSQNLSSMQSRNKSHITEWNKKKIIYEQQVEKIKLLK